MTYGVGMGVQLYEWDHIAGAWVKAPACVTSKRMVAVGQVVAGIHKLYWVECTPSGPTALWDLSDDLDGLGAIVLSHFDTDKHSDILQLSPPMRFVTGIYLKTFTAMTSVTFGYI